MKLPQSLQATLGTGLTLGVILFWIAALLSAVLIAQNKLNELFDSALAETAQRIMPLAVVEILNREVPGPPQSIAAFKAHDEPLTYLVRDKAGTVLLQSHNADPSVFDTQLLEGFSSSPTHRFYGASAVQDTLYITVAEPLTQRQAATLEIAVSLLWPLALLVPLCFIGTWSFVRRSLRQTLAYRDEIESRGSGDLSPVNVHGLPTEILSIAESVNNLLDRLRRALESERSFTANSAHELRTPIATALAQIQRLQQEPSTEAVKDKLSKIESSLRSLSCLSEKLMQLAKAEGAGLLSTEQHDLIDLLKLIIEDIRRSPTAAVINVSLPENDTFMSFVDPDAFAILVRNLLDNAIKHGAKNQPVAISFSPQGVLSIINAGRIIPADKLSQLRQRFVRYNPLVQGSGLGLAIADAIVTGIGATMSFNSPAPEQDDGVEVYVDFSALIN